MVRVVAANRPRGNRSQTVTAFIYAFAVHLVVLALLVVSRIDVAKPPRPESRIIQAVAVDKRVIDQELNQRRIAEEQKRRAERQRREAKVAAEKARIEEQRRQAEAEQQRQEEQVRQAEQEKQREEEIRLKAEADKQKRQEEEKRKADQEEQREQEEQQKQEEKREQEAEKSRIEEEKKRIEEQQRKEDALREQALADALADEEKQRQSTAAGSAAVDAAITKISRRLARFFNKTGLPPGLTCEAGIRMVPGGEVVFVQIIGSSGNALFDRQCETAIRKASPLPVPGDQVLFEEKFRKLNIRFNPWE